MTVSLSRNHPLCETDFQILTFYLLLEVFGCLALYNLYYQHFGGFMLLSAIMFMCNYRAKITAIICCFSV